MDANAPRIIQLLTVSNDSVRAAAVQALANAPAAVKCHLKAILALLEHDYYRTRESALKVLASSLLYGNGDVGANAPRIIQMLDDTIREVRLAAVQALLNLPEVVEERLESFYAFLEHDSWRMRESALKVLAAVDANLEI